MHKKSGISIVIPTFNSGSTVKQTLDSIYSQDFQNFEIIIKDGLSTDDTLTILNNYDDRVRVISAIDAGIYHAMNIGIDYSSFDNILILNSDDFLINNCVLSQAIKYLQSGIDCLFFDILIGPGPIDKDLFVRRHWKAKIPTKLNFALGYIPAHPGFFCKKYVYLNNKLKEQYRVASDFDFYIRIMKSNYSMKSINIPSVYMLEGGASYGYSYAKVKLKLFEIFSSFSTNGFIFYGISHIFFRTLGILKFKIESLNNFSDWQHNKY